MGNVLSSANKLSSLLKIFALILIFSLLSQSISLLFAFPAFSQETPQLTTEYKESENVFSFSVSPIAGEFNKLTYELPYFGSGRLQGVRGEVSLNGQEKFEREYRGLFL